MSGCCSEGGTSCNIYKSLVFASVPVLSMLAGDSAQHVMRTAVRIRTRAIVPICDGVQRSGTKRGMPRTACYDSRQRRSTRGAFRPNRERPCEGAE
jgi:hypothetical protein